MVSGSLVQAEIEYLFSIYHATFDLETASTYSCIIQLLQQGGLLATYYETTSFQAPLNDLPSYDHLLKFFTQIDSQINFEPLERAFTLKSASTIPSQYFSIKWEGFLQATFTETFRIYIEAFKTS
jgi:hypothetical protein